MTISQNAKKAIYIGTLCSVAYLAVYLARNILGAVTPQMIDGGYSEAYIGNVSSVYFICYALGQLINGIIGDKIKAKYMISFGLLLAGITNILFPSVSEVSLWGATALYGGTGFFLAMIYGPMTKVVAENTEPIYATRCSLGYTFASFLGSPMAGVFAAVMAWQKVFFASTAALVVMAVLAFVIFSAFERKGIVKYNQFKPQKETEGGSIGLLIKHRIIRFTLISAVTGVTRTTVVFWMPTYFNQYLGYSLETSSLVFTVASFIIAFATFLAVFVYEKMHHNMDMALFSFFSVSTLFFILMYFIKIPSVNVVLFVIAVLAADAAAAIMWSRYCPGLRDTGMVSSATGFLDFISYVAAALSSIIFANAVDSIGWGNLILVWFALMAFGTIITIPKRNKGEQ